MSFETFAPRPISKEEYEKITKKPLNDSQARSKAQMQLAIDRHTRVQQFQQRMTELLLTPQVDTFREFLNQLKPDERTELLQRLSTDD